MRGVAFAISRLVQLERDAVRTDSLRFIRLRAPASIEAVAQCLFRIAIKDFEPVASVLYRDNDLAPATSRNGDRRCFDQLLGFREARVPAPLIIESPVVVPVLAEQAHGQ